MNGRRLWLDGPGAPERIDALLKRDRITADEAHELRAFALDGFALWPAAVAETLLSRSWSELDEAMARGTRLTCHREGEGVFALSEIQRWSGDGPAFAVHDFHELSAATAALVGQPELVRRCALILGGEPLLMQSQMFRHSSGKGVHRDAPFFPLRHPLLALTVWIAAEPVDVINGALQVYPGSHRVAPMTWGDARLHWPHGENASEIQSHSRALADCLETRGVSRRLMPMHTGDVLFMHPNLAHAAASPEDPTRTRRSIVLHLTTHEASEP